MHGTNLRIQIWPYFFVFAYSIEYILWPRFIRNTGTLDTRSPHMLDKFNCSRPLLPLVKDFKAFNIGMCSDHIFILTTFKITAIKFKVTEKIVAQNDWKLIGYHKMNNELFNNRLSMSISGSTTYSKYNKHIL